MTSLENSKIYDITIIGAGPVGLFGTFYAGMRHMSTLVIDSLPQVGGQLNALYPEKYIYDMPGFAKVMAKDLVHELWEQAKTANPDLSLNTKVTKISAEKNGDQLLHYKISTESGATFFTKTIMLALGMGAFRPQRLTVPGLDEREGKTVHYILKPLSHYDGKEILLIGGGDSAVDWALAMAAPNDSGKVLAANTTVIHRSPKFTAHEASVVTLKNTKAKIHLQTELRSIEEVMVNGKTKIRASIEQNLTKEKNEVLVDEIIICIGYLVKLDFVKESGLAMQGNTICVNDRMETNLPGVFAVGDVCSHNAKLKLIATGVGEAAIAANLAKVYIDPTAKAFPGHSTSKVENT